MYNKYLLNYKHFYHYSVCNLTTFTYLCNRYCERQTKSQMQANRNIYILITNLTTILQMAKRKPIKVRIGCIKKLAEITGYSVYTVRLALRYTTDSDAQNLIRKKAYELGFVRRF